MGAPSILSAGLGVGSGYIGRGFVSCFWTFFVKGLTRRTLGNVCVSLVLHFEKILRIASMEASWESHRVDGTSLSANKRN